MFLNISDLHLGNQRHRAVDERFRIAFSQLIDFALEHDAGLRFLGDTFELVHGMVNEQDREREISFFRDELERFQQNTTQPIQIMAGNHDPDISDWCTACLPKNNIEILAPIVFTSEGEILTHGHYLELPTFVRKLQKNWLETGGLEALENVQNHHKVQKKMARRHKHYRRMDPLMKRWQLKTPEKFLRRIRQGDRLFQEKYLPFRAKLYDRFVASERLPRLSPLISTLLCTVLSGADSLAGGQQDAWALLMGHTHVPGVEKRNRRIVSSKKTMETGRDLSVQNETYLYGNCGSFLSHANPPTCILSLPREKTLQLLEFHEDKNTWQATVQEKLRRVART